MTSMKQHDNNKLVKVFIMHFLYSIIRTLHFHHSSIRPITSTVISWSSQSILGLKVSPLSVEVSNSKRKWITKGLWKTRLIMTTEDHMNGVKDRQVCTAVRATLKGGWRPNEPIVVFWRLLASPQQHVQHYMRSYSMSRYPRLIGTVCVRTHELDGNTKNSAGSRVSLHTQAQGRSAQRGDSSMFCVCISSYACSTDYWKLQHK